MEKQTSTSSEDFVTTFALDVLLGGMHLYAVVSDLSIRRPTTETETYLFSMTIAARFAEKFNSTNVADDMLFALHLMKMKSLAIVKVFIANLAVIVLCLFVHSETFLLVEAAITVLVRASMWLAMMC